MHPTVVINVVGLTPGMLGPHSPHLSALARDGSAAPIRAVTPAVTCSVQATYLTGLLPAGHGVVANGWYLRDLSQVLFWRQSNRLVDGEKVWETARRRDPACTTANLFWWFNMYSSVTWSVTPRPIYPADGRKIPDIYSEPAALRARLTADLGPFPFFQFWGPDAGLASSAWIARAADAVDRWHAPTLLLVYLPHLDYPLQRTGPSDPRSAQELAAIDAVCGRLITECRARGRRVVVVSEYGLGDVRRPVHLNRVLRAAGFVAVRDELGHDALDPGASRAFAVADHQVAHVYVRDAEDVAPVRKILRDVPGVEAVLDRADQRRVGLDHARSGELVAIAAPDAWFTYYFWDDDRRAPDYARTVDIHRKPGYDPAELFVDPAIRFPRARVAAALARKALGFRMLMKMIPLDAGLVRGSHGRPPDDPNAGALLISSERGAVDGPLDPTAVRDTILAHVFDGEVRPVR